MQHLIDKITETKNDRQDSGGRIDQTRQKEIRYKQNKSEASSERTQELDHFVLFSLWVEISSMVMKRHQVHIIHLQKKAEPGTQPTSFQP